MSIDIDKVEIDLNPDPAAQNVEKPPASGGIEKTN